MNRPPAVMFGVHVADLTMDETLARIGEFIDIGRRTGRTFQIATTNVDFLVNSMDDPGLRSILQRADLSLADGLPVVWAARWFGVPVSERVAGSDLVPLLAEQSARVGWKIHVLGSSPDVAARAGEIFEERAPGARVTIDPGPIIRDPTDVDDSVIDSIRQVDPDVLCVALGNPKQERFIDAYRERLGVPVAIGVGGSLDMLTGERKRAPEWVQRVGLEWVARALQEPRRLVPRYAHDIRVFGPRLATEWRAVRARRGRGRLTVVSDPAEVRIGAGDAATSADEFARAADGLASGARLVVDTGDRSALDDVSVSCLIGLLQHARWHGAEVEFAADRAHLVAACAAVGFDLDAVVA